MTATARILAIAMSVCVVGFAQEASAQPGGELVPVRTTDVLAAKPFQVAVASKYVLIPGVQLSLRIGPYVDVQAGAFSLILINFAETGLRLRFAEGAWAPFVYGRAGVRDVLDLPDTSASPAQLYTAAG